MSRTAMLVVTFLVALGYSEVITKPEMIPMNIGTECPSWSWKTPPTADGSYDDAGVYTITGNGHAVYMCWDRAAFSFVSQVPLDGDFTLSGRIKTLPDAVPFTVGLTIKGAATTQSNVLDIRYDSYHSQMTWFNRQTDPSKIGLHDQGERGNCQGTTCPPEWEGCLGQGYENRIPDFKETSNIWVRVTRQGIKYYAWVKHEGSDNWIVVKPVSAGKPGTSNEGSDLGTFRVFQTGLVYAGFSLVTVGYGELIKTAQIDNIEIRTAGDIIAGSTATSSQSVARASKIAGIEIRNGLARISLKTPASGASLIELFNLNGKQVAKATAHVSGNSEIQFALPPTLSSGIYHMKVRNAQLSADMPVMVR